MIETNEWTDGRRDQLSFVDLRSTQVIKQRPARFQNICMTSVLDY